MLEEGLGSAYRSHSNDSERDRREAESERLVNAAKENGLYIPKKETESLGEKIQKHTGESVVYINTNTERVYKIKDPYAKSALKSGVQPEDVIYEHQVHNAIFPETEYTLEGISDEYGDVRIVLSQHLVSSKNRPTKEQIAEDLAKRGFKPEGKYPFGDKYVSITDVEGDNVLLGEDGRLYYIDPIINYKKPVKEILERLNSALTTLPLDDTKYSLRNNSQEVADIVAKAKADGTYMKAPNGEPTNLTEEQWANVRTKAFKDWFGDWELVAKSKMIRIAKSVSEAEELIKPLIGVPIKNDLLGITATISRNSLDKLTSEKATKQSTSPALHAQAVANIDILFKNAFFDVQHKDKNGDRNIALIHRLGSLIFDEASNNFVPVKITVKEFTNEENKRIYSVEAIDIEHKKKSAGQLVSDSSKENGITPITDFDTKIQQLVENAKKSSKIVDENGEPMVVYHQTNRTIYRNIETGENWDDLDWRERQKWEERDDWDEYWEEEDFYAFNRKNARTTNEFDGFFFAPKYDEYHEYGDRTIEVFLNIRKPASREDYHIDAQYNDAGRKERIKLQEEGYDGVIREEDGVVDEYVAFEPNQIKSATDNVEFGEGDDIRYSLRSDVGSTESALDAMKDSSPKGWESIKDKLRGTPIWNEVAKDANYTDDDAITKEALSRLKVGIDDLTQEMTDNAKGVFEKAEAVAMADRMRRALNEFDAWVEQQVAEPTEGEEGAKYSLRTKPAPKKNRSNANRQDLTTSSSTQMNDRTKVEINPESAKKQLKDLAEKYRGINNPRGFLTDLNIALGKALDESSNYYSLELPNKGEVTIRISNHNVDAENAEDGEKERSIVIKSRRSPNTFNAKNGVDMIEYVYFKEDIKGSNDNILSQIAESLHEMMETGEYNDKSGIAKVNPTPKYSLRVGGVLHPQGDDYDGTRKKYNDKVK